MRANARDANSKTKPLSEIKSFWDKKALLIGESKVGAHSDPYLVEAENWFIIEKCLKRFKPRKLLDIGCGNGQRTKLFAKYCTGQVSGVDYSDRMIKLATKLENGQVHFFLGDILEQDNGILGGGFDCVVSCRCLINLGSIEKQIAAIDRVVELLRDDGVFAFCEGSLQGAEKLNALRAKCGLDAIKPIRVNLDLDESVVLEHLEKRFRVISKSHLGLYYFLTRVYYPALIFPKAPIPSSKFNKLAARLSMQVSEDISNLPGRHLCLVGQKISH